MRVLHISFADSGGAGLCCLRIHQSLLRIGVESKVVCFYKKSDVPEVYRYGSRTTLFIERAFSKFLDLIGIRLTKRSRLQELYREKKAPYSLVTSFFDLTKNEWGEWADIIQLHWVNWYVDYPSFFRKVKKPIIMTLHDENLFCGAAHYTKDIIPDNEMEKELQQLKLNVIEPLQNVTIVFLSNYMHQQFMHHPIVNGKRQVVINNAVDGDLYRLYDKKEMRQKYDISDSSVLFAFMANDIFDSRKGLDVLVTVLDEINKDLKIKILAIGGNPSNIDVPAIIVSVGQINDADEVSRLLSCCDFFAIPSYQEAFAQSPLEAMACGLPVVAFPCSGVSELINNRNGVICEDFTKEALYEGILLLMSRDYNHHEIRDDVLNRFSSQVIAEKYKKLYEEIV